jgi:hypothetical protein
MARAKVVELTTTSYPIMQRAGNAGQRIEKSDPRWADYVRTNKVNEVGHGGARQKFGPSCP